MIQEVLREFIGAMFPVMLIVGIYAGLRALFKSNLFNKSAKQ